MPKAKKLEIEWKEFTGILLKQELALLVVRLLLFTLVGTKMTLLVDYLKDIQVVITVTGITKELIEKLKPQTLYHIENAQIKEK